MSITRDKIETDRFSFHPRTKKEYENYLRKFIDSKKNIAKINFNNSSIPFRNRWLEIRTSIRTCHYLSQDSSRAFNLSKIIVPKKMEIDGKLVICLVNRQKVEEL